MFKSNKEHLLWLVYDYTPKFCYFGCARMPFWSLCVLCLSSVMDADKSIPANELQELHQNGDHKQHLSNGGDKTNSTVLNEKLGNFGSEDSIIAIEETTEGLVNLEISLKVGYSSLLCHIPFLEHPCLFSLPCISIFYRENCQAPSLRNKPPLKQVNFLRRMWKHQTSKPFQQPWRRKARTGKVSPGLETAVLSEICILSRHRKLNRSIITTPMHPW